MIRRWVGVALLLGLVVGAAPPLRRSPERTKAIRDAKTRAQEAERLFAKNKVVDAIGEMRAAVREMEKLYPAALFPQGQPALATALNNLGVMLDAAGQPAPALKLHERSLAMVRGLYPRSLNPDGHLDLALNLDEYGGALRAVGRPDRALDFHEQALAMRQRLHRGHSHADLALSLNNMGTTLIDLGEPTRALAYFEKSLSMRRRLYKDGSAEIATGLGNVGAALERMGELERAMTYYEQALAMRRKLYPESEFPDGHPRLAISMNNMAYLLKAMGELSKALELYEQTLAMNRRMFPKAKFPRGHARLALSLNNVGATLLAQGETKRGVEHYEKALAMVRQLYPKEDFPAGHPELGMGLNNMGYALALAGEPKKALAFYEEALAQFRRLIPESAQRDGHPLLATSIDNIGCALLMAGEPKKAVASYQQSLAMYQRLYPPARFRVGQIDLAGSLSNLSGALLASGERDKALGYHEQALAMHQRLSDEFARTASETRALNHAASLPLSRDAYLSAAGGHPAERVYGHVWHSRGNLSRIYERRHLAALAASSAEARALFDETTQLRRRRERLLLARAGPDPKARDAELAEIDRDIDRSERALLPLLPGLGEEEALSRAAVADLRKALPADGAFVDLLLYIRFEGAIGSKDETRVPHYVAFVVVRGGVARAELGPAAAVEEAVSRWRKAIREGRPDGEQARAVRRLVWEPIARHLPAAGRVVYLAPDMGLTSLPWAALPGRRAGTVLLEEIDPCVVPHGPWLLGKLTSATPTTGKASLLAVGGVAYDDSPSSAMLAGLRTPLTKRPIAWQALPGAAREAEQISKLAVGLEVRPLRGGEARADVLLKALPRARYAHLATHGFFADAGFRSVLQLDEKLFSSPSLGDRQTRERVGAGARSPMVLSGLVCAGANRDETPGRGILTADAVSLLDLRQMRLAVLSACETGLGETAGGEGVFGLQRAFHIGGARNVVASLWQVLDESTAALMNRFYANLWQAGKPTTTREALRRAMLDVYRNPGLVKDWSQGRGVKPDVVDVPDGAKPVGKTAGTKQWAAWVLSGPGD